MGKKVKVYCKHCRWFRFGGFFSKGCSVFCVKNKYFAEKYINHKGERKYKWKNKKEADNMLVRYKINKHETSYHIRCCNFNKDYNCKYYRRKWWLFLVGIGGK